MKKMQKIAIHSFIASLAMLALNSSCNPVLWQGYPTAVYLGNTDGGYPTYLKWSPVDERIVVTSYSDNENVSKIFILDTEHKEIQQIFETPYGIVIAVGWSSDGKHIILTADDGVRELKPGIWLLDVDDKLSDPEFLSNGDLAAWSPNGNMLAVFKISRESPVWDMVLHIVDLRTSDDRIIYKTRGKFINGLSWSPNGTQLTFALAQEEQIDDVNVYILNIVSGELVMLTTSGNASSPVWSPTGNRIAYVDEDRNGDTKLYIQEPDSSCRLVVPNIVNISSPAWSPDGRYVAFIGEFGGIYELDLVKLFGEQFLDGIDC